MEDRTLEFQNLARSLPGLDVRSRKTLTPSGIPSAPLSGSAAAEDKGTAAKNNPAYAELRSFQLTAGGISKDIAATSALLTELTQLVRNQSLIPDPAETDRINTLVVLIKTNVENLNARLDHAARIIAQQKRRLGQNSQVGQQASNLVDELKTEFAHAASGFKKILQQRTDTMKETEYLQKKVYNRSNENDDNDDVDDNPIPNMSWAPPPVYGRLNNSLQVPTLDLTGGMTTGEPTASPLPRPHGISYSGGGGVSSTPYHSAQNSFFDGDHDMDLKPLTPLDIQRMEQESGLQMQLIPDQTYFQNRAEAMSAVEANIVELGTIFQKLAGMVAEHREMVQRVEDNVDEANTNINLSLTVLTDTLQSLRTNKMLALRVFGVLVVFIILFVVFFA